MASVTLSLESRKYKNNIIYDSNMNVLYWIEQQGSKFFGTNPIHIYRASPKGSREEVGIIEFHSAKRTLVTYKGETQEMRDMFPKKSWKGSARLVQMPIGECRWSGISNYTPTLYDPSNRPIASYASNAHLFHKSSPATLEVSEKAMDSDEMMDLIVMGWIIVMRDVECIKQSIAGSAASSSGASVAAAISV